MPLNELGLAELARRVQEGEITPVDVMGDVVSAYEAREPEIRAYINFDGDALMEEAKRVTEAGTYRTRPLAGLPVAIKDNICVKDGVTTAGSRILAGYRSLYDATVVERLRAAGAIIAGKTNLDEFAMGSSTENSAFGPSRNPHDTGCAPGGSSGGSAAAVAAHIAVAALGSDTGGSIRQPAAFCGVTGMKPTYGRVSRYGLIAFASSLDQIGPFGRNVEDCACLLGAMAGHDPHDATSLRTPVPDFCSELSRGLDGLRIGVPWAFCREGMETEVEANFAALTEALGRAGATVEPVDLEHAHWALACYYIIANAEASSNLARYDGVKYGHRTERDDSVYSMYTKTRDEGFGAEVKRRVLLGTYVLSAGYYDAYYLKAQKVRSLIVRDFARAFERCDVMVWPTSPSPAFHFGEKSDPLLMYLSDIFTIPVNLAGLPGISVPSGFSTGRLPLGVQVVTRALDEVTLFRAAKGIEDLVALEGDRSE